MNKIAVVLLNLGGPDSLDAVQPFLENLFNDPDIFKLPFQKQLAKFISKKRAPKIIEEYKLIGGSSPINYWTELQRNLLREKLNSSGLPADVFIAMRYWKPLTEETIKEVNKKLYDKIILLPLYPHFSVSTTGSSFNEWKRHYSGEFSKLEFIESYYNHPLYIQAINQRIDQAILKFPADIRSSIQFVFSAHGTPVSYVKNGDPYSKQIIETVNSIMNKRGNSHNYHLCYQSKVGPAKWLEPSTPDTIQSLASKGFYNLLIIPISFVSDHVETLYELGIQYKKIAEKAGIKNYIVMNGLNDSALFIDALSDLILKQLKL